MEQQYITHLAEAYKRGYEIKYNNVVQKVTETLSNIYAREDVQIVQERIIKTIECNFLQEQINSIHNALQTWMFNLKKI